MIKARCKRNLMIEILFTTVTADKVSAVVTESKLSYKIKIS